MIGIYGTEGIIDGTEGIIVGIERIKGIGVIGWISEWRKG